MLTYTAFQCWCSQDEDAEKLLSGGEEEEVKQERVAGVGRGIQSSSGWVYMSNTVSRIPPLRLSLSTNTYRPRQ